MNKQGRNPNRGVILSLADAYAIHRWLELLMDDRQFFNPVEAHEAKKAVEQAKQNLFVKLANLAAKQSAWAEADDEGRSDAAILG